MMSENHVKKAIIHLRKQPDHIKRSILHAATIICGVVLVFMWIYSLGNNVSQNSVSKNKITEDLKPFSVLKNNLASPSSW